MMTDTPKSFFAFARLIKDGWINFNDLKDLSEGKIGRIKSLFNTLGSLDKS